MKKLFAPLFFILICVSSIQAQNVGIGTTNPKASAVLDVTATNKGMLLPRLTTTQRKAIVNPERGLFVFDTDKGTFMFFDGAFWKGLAATNEDAATLSNRIEPNPSLNAHLGQAVDIYGNYAIISAPFYSVPGVGYKFGEAYIFFKDETGWKSQARLMAPDSANEDFFGSAVAIYGDYCVVGAANKNVNGNLNQGKAYVYKRNGTAWNLEAALTDPNGGIGNNFGYSVDITITTSNIPVIAIGVPYWNDFRGKVLTYIRDGNSNTWNFLQTISPNDLGYSDRFGIAVSMHKDYLAIGAPNQTNPIYNNPNAGSVYINVFGGGVFTQQQKIEAYYSNGLFGYSLSIYEDKLAIGAPGICAEGNQTGSADVKVFLRNGTIWDNIYTNFSIPESEGGTLSMKYGKSISLSNDQLLISAPFGIIYPGGSGIYPYSPGSAYLWVTTDGGATYYKKQKINLPDAYVPDFFGHSVSIESTGNYIIGTPYQNVFTSGGGLDKAGGVYFGYNGQ